MPKQRITPDMQALILSVLAEGEALTQTEVKVGLNQKFAEQAPDFAFDKGSVGRMLFTMEEHGLVSISLSVPVTVRITEKGKQTHSLFFKNESGRKESGLQDIEISY